MNEGERTWHFHRFKCATKFTRDVNPIIENEETLAEVLPFKFESNISRNKFDETKFAKQIGVLVDLTGEIKYGFSIQCH